MKRFLTGITDFQEIIRRDIFYVDKTKYIEMVENDAPYLMFIRPRRFGKSLFVNTLCRYYDINGKEQFPELFGNLYIGKHPTPEQGTYLILYFNFSAVAPKEEAADLEESFQKHCALRFREFATHYRNLLGDKWAEEVEAEKEAVQKLALTESRARECGLPIYVVIDEYDNFANNILAGDNGHSRYKDLTHGTGFFRTFFTFLKACTGNEGSSAVKRIFMTGVSPLVLDDVTSGFNIARNISVKPKYSAMLGFTEEDVRAALQEIQEGTGLQGTLEGHLETMREYYDNYRFSADCERVFNTNMTLYYLAALADDGRPPQILLDSNTRTDYNKLHHLIVLDKRLNGNFGVLCKLAVERSIVAELVDCFPLEELKYQNQFVSLLFYMGILTIDKPARGETLFRVPNRTVGKILVSYIVSSLNEVGTRLIDTGRLESAVHGMAYDGEWQKALDFIHRNIVDTTSIRDFIKGERAIQVAHLVALWPVKCYLTRTEREAKKGYLDLLMVPDRHNAAEVRYSYIIELKYLPGDASDADQEKAVVDAKAQLTRYASDALIRSQCKGTTLVTIALVYKQWDIACCEAVETLAL